jgi:hypothetical protein
MILLEWYYYLHLDIGCYMPAIVLSTLLNVNWFNTQKNSAIILSVWYYHIYYICIYISVYTIRYYQYHYFTYMEHKQRSLVTSIILHSSQYRDEILSNLALKLNSLCYLTERVLLEVYFWALLIFSIHHQYILYRGSYYSLNFTDEKRKTIKLLEM